MLAGETIDFTGQHLRVKGAKVLYPPVQKPYPPLYFGGSSPAAHELAARHMDVYLTWGEPPDAVAQKIADMRERAARHGRALRFGIRLHVIVRETAKEAWHAADDLIEHLDDSAVAAAQSAFARFDSEGQRRMSALARRAPRQAGGQPEPVGRRRPGPRRRGNGAVGDPETVAARMLEYADLGIETFILSGYPHLEEAYRVAELLFPLPAAEAIESRSTGQTNLTGPFGEMLANDILPKAAQS